MAGMDWVWPGSSVVRVVDGDTFVARVSKDIGFHGSVVFEVRLRLDGINAPPADSDAGKQSASSLAGLMLGAVVNITTTGPYKYGDEWMARVVLADGTDVASWMVSNGHAVKWDGRGARPGG